MKWDRDAAIFLLEWYDCQKRIKLIQLHVGSFQFKDQWNLQADGESAWSVQ